MSIDYVLDLVRRLTEYPETYVTDGYEKFIRKEDYSEIFSWYKIYYPELFQFHNLNIRLDLYSTEYDLKLMRSHCSPRVGIKAAGGVRDLDELIKVRDLDYSRCGTTASAAILDEYRKKESSAS